MLNTANTFDEWLAIWSPLRVGVHFLTDVELVSKVPDTNARELRADEAEDPVGCDCGGCTPEFD